MKMAVVGKDVSKSLSPKMHTFLMKKLGAECTYETVSVSPEAFEEKIEELLSSYDTLNVTIPFKRSVMPHLRAVEGDARAFGAVNTVKCRERAGYNTDGEGFLLSLVTSGVQVKGKKALVLGTGGVGRSVIKKLADAGADVFAFDLNREAMSSVYEEFHCFTPLQEVKEEPYDLILNCTGIGMHKSEGKSPVGAQLLSLCEVAYDLIYEPKKSEFLRIAESLGKQIVNGVGMLFYQAYYADCIFLGREVNAEEAKALFAAYTEEA